MARKFLLIILFLAVVVNGPGALVWAEHLPSDADSDLIYPQESIQEMGEELARVLTEHLYEFLQKELNRLKKGRAVSREALRKEIKQYEAAIKRRPNDAESRFILGEIYAEIGDGASAIIQTKMAEELFVREKNMKGVAECRRNLRRYYKEYDFNPDDFILIR